MAQVAKLSNESSSTLKQLVRLTGDTQIHLIEEALIAYLKLYQLRQLNDAYAKLRQDEALWQEELAEREVLEQTLEDGLSNG